MLRILTAIVVTVVLALSFATPVAAGPMEFAEHANGAMRIDGNSAWISAEGEITAETPAAFEKFLASASIIWKKQRIVLDSPGGSVLAGMKLGAIIRQHQFLTAVARSLKRGVFSSLQPGKCASSCVFAFAGGVERSVVAPSAVGVHQISVDYKSLHNTTVVSVEELDRSFAAAQTLIGLSISHFLEMGIDPSIVTIMTGKAPTEIRWLSRSELESTKLAYDPSKQSDWAVEPYKAGIVAFTKSVDGTRRLSLFCAANKMKFVLAASGGPYANSFLSSVGKPKTIEIAGLEISEPNFKMSNVRNGMVIAGDWTGTEVRNKHRSMFSLFGKVNGSVADLFSIYEFNELGFRESLRLARKNCVS